MREAERVRSSASERRGKGRMGEEANWREKEGKGGIERWVVMEGTKRDRGAVIR